MQQYRDFPFKVQMSGKPRGELFLFPFPPTTTYSESFFVSKLPLSWDLMRKKFRIRRIHLNNFFSTQKNLS